MSSIFSLLITVEMNNVILVKCVLSIEFFLMEGRYCKFNFFCKIFGLTENSNFFPTIEVLRYHVESFCIRG